MSPPTWTPDQQPARARIASSGDAPPIAMTDPTLRARTAAPFDNHPTTRGNP